VAGFCLRLGYRSVFCLLRLFLSHGEIGLFVFDNFRLWALSLLMDIYFGLEIINNINRKMAHCVFCERFVFKYLIAELH
jgi:hypothetical protein